MDANCVNPTAVSDRNTANCESLPSKVANFTVQLFGDVVKTDTQGRVAWTLPCGLETGLPSNPKGVGEGVACYFLRLLYDNIQALRGDQGIPGVDGVNGEDAISATLSDFIQPSDDSPITLDVLATRALVPSLIVFIQNSGWYDVIENNGSSATFSLREALSFAPAVVPLGAVIVPVSPQGLPIVGDKGPPGDKGSAGPDGDQGNQGRSSDSGEFGSLIGVGKNDFVANITSSTAIPVLLNGTPVDIKLTASGTYYVVGTVAAVRGTSCVMFLASVVYSVVDNTTNNVLSSYNTQAEADAAVGSGQHVEVKIQELLDTTFQATAFEPRLIQTLFATVSPRTLRLYVNQDATALVKVSASALSFNWYQIA